VNIEAGGITDDVVWSVHQVCLL